LFKVLGKKLIERAIERAGLRSALQPSNTDPSAIPPDLDPESIDIIHRVCPYTMTSAVRVFALIQAVRYVVNAKIAGSIVECGVWQGGSMMAAAYALKSLGRCDRDLYLFDTYEGMTRPGDADISHEGDAALTQFEAARKDEDTATWCYAPIEKVRTNLFSTAYDRARFKFIKGKVEDTIPAHAPDQIAILRLDTDWYASTRHELVHLYPRLSAGGVLIIDDYGHWRGSRKAVDEYFAEQNIRVLLNRVDYTGRIAVKP
jgi:O-methyltransferase